jgi:hypothetical protein
MRRQLAISENRHGTQQLQCTKMAKEVYWYLDAACLEEAHLAEVVQGVRAFLTHTRQEAHSRQENTCKANANQTPKWKELVETKTSTW